MKNLEEIKKEIIAQNLTCLPEGRFDNILSCAKSILENRVPGDFVETGVWRGGACIFMRSILKQFGDNDRKVFVCDSFEGLPKDETPQDFAHRNITDNIRAHSKNLAVSLEEVQANFKKLDAENDSVLFVKGWFKDTLPNLATNSIALLRLDGDMYSSTMDALNNLYHKVSKGGFIIVDDYGHFPQCKEAVDEFREKNKILIPFQHVDYTCIYWEVS